MAVSKSILDRPIVDSIQVRKLSDRFLNDNDHEYTGVVVDVQANNAKGDPELVFADKTSTFPSQAMRRQLNSEFKTWADMLGRTLTIRGGNGKGTRRELVIHPPDLDNVPSHVLDVPVPDCEDLPEVPQGWLDEAPWPSQE